VRDLSNVRVISSDLV